MILRIVDLLVITVIFICDVPYIQIMIEKMKCGTENLELEEEGCLKSSAKK